MKVPLQEKIAELESRIAALEKWARLEPQVYGPCVPRPVNIAEDRNWKKMWFYFDRVVKRVFGG